MQESITRCKAKSRRGPSDDRLRNGRDDALLDDDPRLDGLAKSLLGDPLLADGQPQGALVLARRLEGVRQLRGEVARVL